MAQTYLNPGDTPLDLPKAINGQGANGWGSGYWQGAGGGTRAQEYYATLAFNRLFGRNPTQSELDQYKGAYDSGDPNKANVSTGDSVVSQYYNNKVNTPEKQAADQQAAYAKDASKYYDEINGQFQSTLGRDATQAEKDHFGVLRASGQVDPYTIGQFLSQLPENVQKQDAAFQESLRTKTSAEDSRYFGEQILPGIQRNFAQQGRSVDSSGFANAAAQAGQQQNVAREGFLTNLSASQYGGNKENAYNEYLNSVGRVQAGQDYSRSRTDQLSDQLYGRVNEIANFNLQKQSYDQYLQRYGKRSDGVLGAFSGAMSGAMAGGMAGGTTGAFAGAIGGAGLGYFGSR